MLLSEQQVASTLNAETVEEKIDIAALMAMGDACKWRKSF